MPFCKNGITTSMHSKPAVSKPVAKKSKLCSPIRQNLNLGRPSDTYCRECLRKRMLTHPNEKSVVAKKECRTSRLGCPKFDVPICKFCWEDFKHKSKFK